MLPYDQCPYPYKLLEEQSEQQTLKIFVDFNYLNIEKWQTLFCVLANFTFELSKMKMTFLTPGTNVGIFSID